MSLFDCDELYSQISKEEMNDFYMIHFRTIRVEAREDHEISPRLVRFYNWFINHFAKGQTVGLYQGGPKITLYDYLTTMYTFYYYDDFIESDRFETIKKIKEHMDQKGCGEQLCEEILDALNSILFMASLYGSHILSSIYLFNLDVHMLGETDQKSYVKLILYREMVQVLSVKLNGKIRPVYRLGSPHPLRIRWLTIDARTMQMPLNISDKVWDLYIQGHAWQRLKERLDNQEYYVIYRDLLVSLVEPLVHVTNNGQRLIEYRLNGQYKIGYLVSEVVNDVVVIRTFLMLTHQNTPEGERLKKILNSTKTDTTYWALDRLSTFSASDIDKKETLKQKFIEAGCETLFNIDFSRNEISQKGIEQAEAMVKYFGLDEDEEDGTKAQRNEGAMGGDGL